MKSLGAQKFESFGNYVFLKKLAAGGMAEVFLARPNSPDANGRVQVVKCILPHVATNSTFLIMFQREIRIIMGFNHPHIVQLHEFGHVENQPYIAMEYIEGKSLKDLITRFRELKEKIPIPVVLSLMAQAASGLRYAHEFVNKITGEELHAVHRDISPHNLIVSYDGNLKVIDFGIAKAACSLQDLTQTGVIRGKAAYCSPEQVAGEKIDERTDVFALGIVLWEMLAGERLFTKAGESELTAMAKVSACERHVIVPSKFNDAVPPELDTLVLRALKKDPEDRIPTAREFQNQLREIMIRHYPNFSYSNVGEMMHLVFKHDIESERMTVRDLNKQVQMALVGIDDDETKTMETETPNPNTGAAGIAPRGTTSSTPAPRSSNDTATSRVDLRLLNIEKLMKQKATTRHYVMLAFYIVTIIALKVTERWDFSATEKAEATEQVQIAKRNIAVPLTDKKSQQKLRQTIRTPAAAQQAIQDNSTQTGKKKVVTSKKGKLSATKVRR